MLDSFSRRRLLFNTAKAASFGMLAGSGCLGAAFLRTASAAEVNDAGKTVALAAKARIDAAREVHGAMESFRFDDLEVLGLFDSAGEFPASLLPDADAHPERLAYMPSNVYPSIVKTYVIRCGERIALVDAGNGRAKKGRMLENLAAAGISPDKVTDVLLTHLHGDHIGGLLENGSAVFPKAVLRLSAPEYEAWIEKGTESAPAAVELARRTMAAYGERVAQFRFGDEVFPKVRAEACTGHTSGHARFDVATGASPSAGLTIAGDYLHIQPLQSRYPDCSTRYDVHSASAAQTRSALLQDLAQSGRLVAGMHFDFVGRVTALDAGFAITPVK